VRASAATLWDCAYAQGKNSAADLYGFPPEGIGALQLVDSMAGRAGMNAALEIDAVRPAVDLRVFRFFTTTRRRK